MKQEDIHYRTGGTITHAGIEILPSGRDIEYIVLQSIEFREKEKVNGKEQEGVWIGHFAPNPYTKLPWIINTTNRKRLVKLFPECEGYPARLRNVAIRLTKELTRDPQGGGQIWGLRVSNIPPTEPKQESKRKVITKEKVEAVISWAKTQGKSFEDVKASFDFASPEVEKEVAAGLLPAKSDDLPE